MTGSFEMRGDKVLALPIDELGLKVLTDVAASNEWNSANWMGLARESFRSVPGAMEALAEAWSWLYSRGLVARDYQRTDHQAIFVTRLGKKVLAEGVVVLRASERLSMDLHPKLERKVRRQWLMGEYELAAFAAMKEVEVAVRDAAGASDSEIGVRLMRAAFGNSGPLYDSRLDSGEADATRELYSGAIGLFKNPSSHRPVDFSDLTIAAEIILLADLLLRMLDR